MVIISPCQGEDGSSILLARSKFYVGRTHDLKRRIREHKERKCWTTKRFLPIKFIFYEAFLSKGDAIRRERYFKTSKGRSTLKLILRDSLK